MAPTTSGLGRGSSTSSLRSRAWAPRLLRSRSSSRRSSAAPRPESSPFGGPAAVWAALAVLLAALAPGCRGKSERAAEAAVAASSLAKSTLDGGPTGARRAAGTRWLLLGRLVDLGRFEIIQTLSELPDQEVTIGDQDVGLVRLRDWRIQAFRLSTGERLWEVAPAAPCRNLVLGRASVVAGCGAKVVSFALQDR